MLVTVTVTVEATHAVLGADKLWQILASLCPSLLSGPAPAPPQVHVTQSSGSQALRFFKASQTVLD